MNRFSALCIPLALAACGGGSAYDAYGDLAVSLADRYEEADVTAPMEFPIIDTATYSGVAAGTVGGVVSAEEDFAGALSVDVDFAGNSFDGEITDLVNEFDETIGGSVDLEGTLDLATVDPFVQIDGTLAGVITTPDGLVTTVDGEIGGSFGGVGAPALFLLGEGEIENFLGTDDFFVFGIAER